MKQPSKTIRTISIALFAAGFLIGFALWGASVWADLESTTFNTALSGAQKTRDLQCPVFMTRSESEVVKVNVTNQTDRILKQPIRIHISFATIVDMTEDNVTLELQPGETRQVSWNIFPEDAVWDRMVLVRAYLFANYPTPARTSTCGVMVLDITGLHGNQVLIFMIAASLAGMIGGLAIWILNYRPLRGESRSVAIIMSAFLGAAIAGTTFALSGIWVVGGILLILTCLGLLTIIGGRPIKWSDLTT